MKKILLFIFLITISCSNNKVVNNHGFGALELKADKINISKTNKNDVVRPEIVKNIISAYEKN